MAQNWHFCSFWARLCWLIWCPVGGLVGGCGARAVSRTTPIYFILYCIALHIFIDIVSACLKLLSLVASCRQLLARLEPTRKENLDRDKPPGLLIMIEMLLYVTSDIVTIIK